MCFFIKTCFFYKKKLKILSYSFNYRDKFARIIVMQKVVNYRPLFYIFVFLLCGIISAEKIFDGDMIVLIMMLVGIILTTIWLCVFKKVKALCILLSAFLLGGGLFFLGKARYKVNDYSGYVTVVGRVTDSVQEGNFSYNIILDDVKINGSDDKNISLYLKCGNGERIKAGDRLAFETQLESVSLWTLKNFNTYYFRNDIGYRGEINAKYVTILEGGVKLDEKIRLAVKGKLFQNLSQENAGLCYALLFGDKVEIASETLNNYKNAGVIHILAVSGLHVSFLLSLILGLMKLCRVNRYVSFATTSFLIIFFAYLCAFTPSVVRAGLMGIFFMLSKITGRRYDSLSSLGLAGSIILIFSPLTAFDIGFLMSVFCVFGICILSKIFMKFFVKFMPDKISSPLAVSLASQVVTLPFLAYFGGEYNFLSPFVNLIVVPFFGILFPYLVISVVLSILLPFLGFALTPAGWGFSAVTSVVRFLGNTPLSVGIEKVHFIALITFFLLLFVISKLVLCDFRVKAGIISILMIFIVLCGCFVPSIYGDNNTMTFLCQNGQPCFVLTSSQGERLLVDYNSLIKSYSREYGVKNFDYYLSLQPLSEECVQNLDFLNLEVFIASSGDMSCENVMYGEAGRVGDFQYAFLQVEGEVLGVCIAYDGKKVFIATQSGEMYNMIYQLYFYLVVPTLVFAWGNDELSGDFPIISINQMQDGYWASFEKDGNFKIHFGDKFGIKEVLD